MLSIIGALRLYNNPIIITIIDDKDDGTLNGYSIGYNPSELQRQHPSFDFEGASLCLETVLAQVDYKIEEVMV